MKIAWLIGTKTQIGDFDNSLDSINNSGGWNNTQLRNLQQQSQVDKLIIISVVPQKYDSYIEEAGKVKIYHLNYSPITIKINRKLINEIYNIILLEQPDVLDIQGSEVTYSAITYLKNFPCKIILTVHGIAFQCYRFFLRGIPSRSVFCGRTLYDTLFCRGVLEKKMLMGRRANVEKKVLKSIEYVRGRTMWDENCVKSINNEITYFKEELIIRKEFFDYKWDIKACQRYRIFVTQAISPFKSIYTILETVFILKKKFQDVLLVIPGTTFRRGFKKNGYEKLIQRRIHKFGIEKNILFTGNLDATGMANELVKANVFLLQSEIENSPNSLAEAQIIGTPSVSTLTGGTVEYIQNGETGLLYNSYDPVMAAMQIERLFTNDALCQIMCEKERAVARARHNEENITRGLLNIYDQLLNEVKNI